MSRVEPSAEALAAGVWASFDGDTDAAASALLDAAALLLQRQRESDDGWCRDRPAEL